MNITRLISLVSIVLALVLLTALSSDELLASKRYDRDFGAPRGWFSSKTQTSPNQASESSKSSLDSASEKREKPSAWSSGKNPIRSSEMKDYLSKGDKGFNMERPDFFRSSSTSNDRSRGWGASFDRKTQAEPKDIFASSQDTFVNKQTTNPIDDIHKLNNQQLRGWGGNSDRKSKTEPRNTTVQDEDVFANKRSSDPIDNLPLIKTEKARGWGGNIQSKSKYEPQDDTKSEENAKTLNQNSQTADSVNKKGWTSSSNEKPRFETKEILSDKHRSFDNDRNSYSKKYRSDYERDKRYEEKRKYNKNCGSYYGCPTKSYFTSGFYINIGNISFGYSSGNRYDCAYRYRPPTYCDGFYYYAWPQRVYPMRYGFYVWEYVPSYCYPAVYHLYGYIPYIARERVVIVERPVIRYVESPLIIDCDSGYYLSSPSGGAAARALSNISRAWERSDIELLERHVNKKSKIDVFFKGKYDYSIDADDYLKMTEDAMLQIDTVRLEFTRASRRGFNEIVAYGKHIYFNEDGDLKTVYITYTLTKRGTNWVITEVGSSDTPL